MALIMLKSLPEPLGTSKQQLPERTGKETPKTQFLPFGTSNTGFPLNLQIQG